MCVTRWQGHAKIPTIWCKITYYNIWLCITYVLSWKKKKKIQSEQRRYTLTPTVPHPHTYTVHYTVYTYDRWKYVS